MKTTKGVNFAFYHQFQGGSWLLEDTRLTPALTLSSSVWLCSLYNRNHNYVEFSSAKLRSYVWNTSLICKYRCCKIKRVTPTRYLNLRWTPCDVFYHKLVACPIQYSTRISFSTTFRTLKIKKRVWDKFLRNIPSLKIPFQNDDRIHRFLLSPIKVSKTQL